MSAAFLHALTGVGLATLGLYGFVTLRHLLRRLLAINILGSGVFLIMVGLAQRDGSVDPLPQALVLTGIVVAVAATALALVLIRRLYADTGRTDLEADPAEEGGAGAQPMQPDAAPGDTGNGSPGHGNADRGSGTPAPQTTSSPTTSPTTSP